MPQLQVFGASLMVRLLQGGELDECELEALSAFLVLFRCAPDAPRAVQYAWAVAHAYVSRECPDAVVLLDFGRPYWVVRTVGGAMWSIPKK